MTAVADRLDEARALVERGWCQHTSWDCLHDGSPLYCSLGAIDMAARSDRLARELMITSFAEAVGIAAKGAAVADWNDMETRTQKHVADAFKRAAENARDLCL